VCAWRRLAWRPNVLKDKKSKENMRNSWSLKKIYKHKMHHTKYF